MDTITHILRCVAHNSFVLYCKLFKLFYVIFDYIECTYKTIVKGMATTEYHAEKIGQELTKSDERDLVLSLIGVEILKRGRYPEPLYSLFNPISFNNFFFDKYRINAVYAFSKIKSGADIIEYFELVGISSEKLKARVGAELIKAIAKAPTIYDVHRLLS